MPTGGGEAFRRPGAAQGGQGAKRGQRRLSSVSSAPSRPPWYGREMAADFDVLSALTRFVEAQDDLYVEWADYADETEDRLGWFQPPGPEEGDPPPFICIFVGCVGKPRAIDPLADGLTLAHELGHHRSWERAQRSSEYNQAVLSEDWTGLSERAKHLIVEEEARAWDHARQILQGLGVPPEWNGWEEFERRIAQNKEQYRRRLFHDG